MQRNPLTVITNSWKLHLVIYQYAVEPSRNKLIKNSSNDLSVWREILL